MAIEHTLTPVNINVDSAEIINMLTNDNLLYVNLILKCRLLMQKLEVVPPSHLFRKQNRMADMLSKEGVKCADFGIPTFLVVPPMFVSKAVLIDNLGTMYNKTCNHL